MGRNEKLRIFVDGSRRPAVSRMFPCWEEDGHEIVDSPNRADVQLSVVRIYTKTNLPTLLRIDGVYYDKAEDFAKRNTTISESHSAATAIVYQSYTSKLMCEKYLGKRTALFYEVIYNGVDEKNWNLPRIDHEGANIVSCAKWRRVKRLPEMIEIFQAFFRRFPNSKLHIIGPMSRGANPILSDGVLYYEGFMEFEDIREIYRKADVHLHLCKKDSCPSNIPESAASGVPVVTTNLCGGAAEMSSLISGCKVVKEGDQSLKPDYIYQEAYNKLPPGVKESVVDSMSNIVKNEVRAELPVELTIEFVAQKYLSLLRRLYESAK